MTVAALVGLATGCLESSTEGDESILGPDAAMWEDAGTPVTDAGSSDGGVEDGGAQPADAGAPTLGELTPQKLAAALEHKDFVMIDVHIPYAGVVPGTDTSIPYDELDQIVAFIGADLERKVVLTCLRGYMSTVAGNQLLQRGYRSVGELQGGMNAWVAAGYSLER